MLRKIVIENLGAFTQLSTEFAPHLNIVCGENGVGKSLLLDSVWFALAHKWSVGLVVPAADSKIKCVAYTSHEGSTEYSAMFDRFEQEWVWSSSNFGNAGLVLYFMADGGLCFFDSIRGSSLTLSQHEIWNGKSDSDKVQCEGLVSDIVKWQNRGCEEFAVFGKILETLSPSGLNISLSSPMRISVDDVRDIPTVTMLYGNVPVLQASSGIRRVLTMAYCLTWVYFEHRQACEMLGKDEDSKMTFIMDDVEANLHPNWQKTMMKSILSAISAMRGSYEGVQMFISTKSPIVAESAKILFDSSLDKMFELCLKDSNGVMMEDCLLDDLKILSSFTKI